MPCESRDISSWMLLPQVEHKAPMKRGRKIKKNKKVETFLL